jgi:glycosyltransferase involved in cell wall biosynthesis
MSAEWSIVAADFNLHGGMDCANYQLALYLAGQAKVDLVAHSVADPLHSHPNITFHRARRPLGKQLLGESFLHRLGKRIANMKNGRSIINGGNSINSDINWVHYVHAAYEPSRPPGFLRGIKKLIDRPRHLSAERKSISQAKYVICNSDVTKKDVIELLDVRPERAMTVYLACDNDIFCPVCNDEERTALRAELGFPLKAPIAVFVGGLGDRRKGFDTVFESWKQLCAKSDWDTTLVVVGRGAELPLWQERCNEAGFKGRIQFLGFRKDVPKILRAADLLISPTRYEPYGLGIHEALCCGLPSIISARAGVAERYPQNLEALLLQDECDPNELTTRLEGWRRQKETWQKLIVPFSALLRSTNWTDTCRQFLKAVDGEM